MLDVRGDGHCYYRCIWQVAMDDARAFEALSLVDTDKGGNDDETEGAIDVRYFVVMSLRYDPVAIDVLHRLLVLADEAVDDQDTMSALRESYPVLSTCCSSSNGASSANGLAFDAALARVRDAIEGTSMYASSLEHEIVSSALSRDADLRLVVLCKEPWEVKEDLSDKWLRQLQKLLRHVSEARVAVLINCANVHYMYVRWRHDESIGRVVLSTRELSDHVDSLMAAVVEFEEEESEFILL